MSTNVSRFVQVLCCQHSTCEQPHTHLAGADFPYFSGLGGKGVLTSCHIFRVLDTPLVCGPGLGVVVHPYLAHLAEVVRIGLPCLQQAHLL